MGESQNVGQCAHHGDLAVAARPTGENLDSVNERTGGLDKLRARFQR
jgi:hypothetical protein